MKTKQRIALIKEMQQVGLLAGGFCVGVWEVVSWLQKALAECQAQGVQDKHG
jgi:hypothetical protein